MKSLLKITLITVLILIVSCQREKLSTQSVVDTETAQQAYTDLDKWIETNITLPYGIAVEYRWDKNTAPKGTYTYPPEVSKVKPVLETIKYLWLELYSEPSLGGANFWKGKAPLKIYLYGGKNIDGNGQELINSSTVGREFHLYNINNFDPRDKNKVYVLMRIVHHQFARLLGDELYPYDRQAFLNISQKDYRASSNRQLYGFPNDDTALYALQYYPKKRDLNNCNSALPFQYFASLTQCQNAHSQAGIDEECYYCNFTQSTPNHYGFITFQAMLSAENDFAEMISVPLTNLNTQIEIAKNIAKTPIDSTDEEAQRAALSYNNLLKKEAFIADYFNKKVGFSLKRLQLLSLQRLNRFNNR